MPSDQVIGQAKVGCVDIALIRPAPHSPALLVASANLLRCCHACLKIDRGIMVLGSRKILYCRMF